MCRASDARVARPQRRSLRFLARAAPGWRSPPAAGHLAESKQARTEPSQPVFAVATPPFPCISASPRHPHPVPARPGLLVSVVPRRTFLAERLLAELGRISDLSALRILGLTSVDISTTKGNVEDWGILGLASLDGRVGVLSSFRGRRLAKNKQQIAHCLGKTRGARARSYLWSRTLQQRSLPHARWPGQRAHYGRRLRFVRVSSRQTSHARPPRYPGARTSLAQTRLMHGPSASLRLHSQFFRFGSHTFPKFVLLRSYLVPSRMQ
jgi:hypothetical protein